MEAVHLNKAPQQQVRVSLVGLEGGVLPPCQKAAGLEVILPNLTERFVETKQAGGEVKINNYEPEPKEKWEREG